MADAVDQSGDEEFSEWFLAPDFQTELMPAPEDLDLPGGADALDVHTVEWDGRLERVRQRNMGDGRDIGCVRNRATLRQGAWALVVPA